MTTARPRVGVGMLLLRAPDQVLLGRRIKKGEPVRWCLPGGHLEFGETFVQAAQRESREETGLAGVDAQVFTVVVDVAHGGVTAGIVAACADGAPEVREPDIFDHWRWWPLSGLPEPLFPASAALLTVWRDRPPPPGWSVHRVAAEGLK